MEWRLSLAVESSNKLGIGQRAVERLIMWMKLWDQLRNEDITRRIRVTDAVSCIAAYKWSWAGYVAIQDANK